MRPPFLLPLLLEACTAAQTDGLPIPGHLPNSLPVALAPPPGGIAPQAVITGEAPGEEFGVALDGGHDINGDGCNDLLIGANWHTNVLGHSLAGAGYARYWGCGEFEALPTQRYEGGGPHTLFGSSVGFAGDFDDDGYGDALFLEYNWNHNQGRAYLYYGGPTGLEDDPGLIIQGAEAHDYGGFRARYVGDINGDGYDDFAVSALAIHGHTTAYVELFYGGPERTLTPPHQRLDGLAFLDLFGSSIAPAGDVNVDGYDDFVVGGSQLFDLTGYAAIYLGGAEGPDDVIYLLGPEPGSRYGATVAGGDFDGDGAGDVAVGGYEYRDHQGIVETWHGSPGGVRGPVARIVGGAPGAFWGRSLDGVPDVDGDDYDDLLVGAPFDFDGQGLAVLLRGTEEGISAAIHAPILSEVPDAAFAIDVTAMGYIGIPGLSTFGVGAPSALADGGFVTVYGVAPAQAEDADQDGYSDLVDCDDLNPEVHPGAQETCGDGIDSDCQGSGAFGDLDDEDLDGVPADAEGLGDDCVADDDGDGLSSRAETRGQDTDGDGVEDRLDDDDDGDGVPTALEGTGDADGDGLADHLDDRGALTLSGGDRFTRRRTIHVQLDFADPAPADICLTTGDTCARFVPYEPARTYTLPAGDGLKVVRAWTRDGDGSLRPPVVSAITLDTAPPTPHNGTATSMPGGVALSWDPFTDATSGVELYRVVGQRGFNPPASCTAGRVIYTGSDTSAVADGLQAGETYTFRVCAKDRANNLSTGFSMSGTADGGGGGGGGEN